MSNWFEQQLDLLYKRMECPIDFVGQERTSVLMQQMLWATGAISFVIGIIFQSLKLTMLLFAAGYVLTLFTTLPPYPAYNQDPVKWLAPSSDEKDVPAPVNKASKGSSESRKKR
ncbi:BQ2448_817 [Microbotryum intermedium]|uniref:Signal peptidase complex subunit 1 n=1 Tax=Microbotryum intermedium TaxID=269621 RepID=A0A238FC90_9BASI|nr:BQ2448_817 [Microbotryum intermedium]